MLPRLGLALHQTGSQTFAAKRQQANGLPTPSASSTHGTAGGRNEHPRACRPNPAKATRTHSITCLHHFPMCLSHLRLRTKAEVPESDCKKQIDHDSGPAERIHDTAELANQCYNEPDTVTDEEGQ